jgi:hypothetical protein
MKVDFHFSGDQIHTPAFFKISPYIPYLTLIMCVYLYN